MTTKLQQIVEQGKEAQAALEIINDSFLYWHFVDNNDWAQLRRSQSALARILEIAETEEPTPTAAESTEWDRLHDVRQELDEEHNMTVDEIANDPRI